MNNLAALGVGCLLPVTIVGDDGEAYDLRAALRTLPVELAGIVPDPARQTPTYTKPLRQDDAGAWRELNRLDLRTRQPLSPATEDRLLAALAAAWSAADGLIVLDQIAADEQGVVTARVRQRLEEMACAAPGKLIFVDSRAHIGLFRCGMLKPNRTECLRAAHAAGVATQDVAAAARWLAGHTGYVVYCTLGDKGLLLAQPSGEVAEIPAVPVAGPIDPVGAGDSTTAGIVAALLAGADHATAAAVGNLVASITIQQLGTTGIATPDQVLSRWREAAASARRPIGGPQPES